MSTAIAMLGGIGLFLLGMSVMTDGLKALAGSALRTVLARAAATPLSGACWGAMLTLLVQSSSAVTMTTIGLVNAGLLTFPQGLGLVFGANVGTTGTGWLVAIIGVRLREHWPNCWETRGSRPQAVPCRALRWCCMG